MILYDWDKKPTHINNMFPQKWQSLVLQKYVYNCISVEQISSDNMEIFAMEKNKMGFSHDKPIFCWHK